MAPISTHRPNPKFSEPVKSSNKGNMHAVVPAVAFSTDKYILSGDPENISLADY